MRISHGTRIKNIGETNGYGYATVSMLKSLSRLGYEVNENDPTADVEIWFDQPPYVDFSDGPYRIHYHPWESTRLKKGWADIMNTADEVWTPSPIVAQWYREGEIDVPVYTYMHGVDKVWEPKKREVEGKLNFLHVGMEASRKGGSETMRAFRTAFPDNDDVDLTMKVISDGWNIPSIGRTKILNTRLSLNEMVSLFHDNHVFVYPSHGEGFGLTPLQALATGMPTITLPAWAPYSDFIHPNLSISSKLLKSQWHTGHHPGKMWKPKFDDIVDSLRYAYDHYEPLHDQHLEQTPQIFGTYDWDTLTAEAFGNLELRL